MASKESILALKITAQNEASTAFDSLMQTLGQLKSTLEGAASSASSAFESIRQAASGSASNVESSLAGEKESIGSLQSVINDLADSIKAQTSSMDSNFNGLTRVIEESTNAMSSSMGRVERSSQQMADSMIKSTETASKGISDAGLLIGMQQIGQAMEGLGEKGAELFKDAITSSAEFEQNISRIHAVLMNREPTANMQEMADTALRLGSSSRDSANTQAEAIYELARQGLSSTQILGDGVNGAIMVVNDLAQATDTSMTDTAKTVTDIVHEYGLSGDHLRSVANIISGALNSSSESMQDFYMSMKQVGPVASSMHQSVDDMSTALAMLGQRGIVGSQAGTALKNMLLGLEPHTAKAAALMNDLGISTQNGAADSFYQLNGNLKPLPDILGILNAKFGGLNDAQKEAALSATFTKYGLAGLNVIATEGKDKFEDFKQSLMDMNAADIAREKMNNLGGDLTKLHSATETMSKAFGDTLKDAMRSVVQEITSVVRWFTGLSSTTKEVIMVVGGITAVMVTVGGAILGVTTAIGFLNMALAPLEVTVGALALPFIAVTAAIVAAGVAAYELYKHWDEAKAKTKELFDKLVDLKDKAIDKVKDAFKVLQDKVDDIKKKLNDFKDQALDAIKKKFDDLKKAIDDHKTAITVTASILGTVFGPALIKAGVEAVTAGAQIATQFVVNVVRTGTEAAVAGAKMATEFIVNVVKSGAEAVIAGGKMTAQFIAAIIKSGAEAVIASGKLTVSLISAVVKLGAEAVITAGKITAQAIVAIVTFTAEGWKTAASIGAQTAALVANAVAVGAQKVVMVASTAATVAATAAQWALNAAMDANPVGLVILAIAALIGIGYELYKHWNQLKQMAVDLWHKIEDNPLLALVAGPIGTLIAAGVEVYKNWDTIKQKAVELWNGITSAFDNIGTFFTNLWSEAEHWGEQVIHMVAQGISNAAHEVAGAAKGVAQQIANFLGFHSPAPMGPAGPGSEKWGGSFASMFANSLAAGAPQVASAAKSLVQPLADVFSGTSSIGSVQQLTKDQMDAVTKYGQLIINAKEQYANAAKTNDTKTMQSAADMANQYRSALDQMGVDSTLFGANLTVSQTMDNIAKLAKASTQSTRSDYGTMTTGLLSDNIDLSASTNASTIGMSNMWATLTTKITATTTELRTKLTDVMKAISDAVSTAAKSMETAMETAFVHIASSAEMSAQRVIAAVAQMRAAMASLNASGGMSASMSSSHTATTSNQIVLSMPSNLGGGGGNTNTFHQGAFTIYVNGSGKNGTQVANDIMSNLRQQTKLAIR